MQRTAFADHRGSRYHALSIPDVAPMPRLLAIDATTEACSVAYWDGAHLTERFSAAPREHMQHLLPMADALLHEQNLGLRDLDAIAFARGPGSFTGLRICVGIVQGLAFGANLPVVPVSTLAAIAQTAATASSWPAGTRLLSAIDARMGEVYWGWFELRADGLVAAISPEQVSAPEQVAPAPNGEGLCVGVGTGWLYAPRLSHSGCTVIDASVLPRAGAVARLSEPLWQNGAQVAAELAEPIYLRDNVAWVKSS